MVLVFTPQPEAKVGDEYLNRDGKRYVIVSLSTPNPIPEDWMYSPLCMAWVRRVSHEEEH